MKISIISKFMISKLKENLYVRILLIHNDTLMVPSICDWKKMQVS